MPSANGQWRPTSTQAALVGRAKLLRDLRQFFESRQVIEVETPLFMPHCGTDIHLSPFTVSGKYQSGYLQTSPEFAMKRLLANGSGDIFQICKAFRQEEAGPLHNPEFTMLEWYRLGFDDYQLIAEIDALLQVTLQTAPLVTTTFADCFIEYVNLDPFDPRANSLFGDWLNVNTSLTHEQVKTLSVIEKWDAVFSLHIQSRLGHQQPIAITHYPAACAALARLDPEQPHTARRFEIFVRGVELANGYDELGCPEQLRQRFGADNAWRASHNMPVMPIDESFLAAMKHGLPACSGVALGVDRLLMLAQEAEQIKDVLHFPYMPYSTIISSGD